MSRKKTDPGSRLTEEIAQLLANRTRYYLRNDFGFNSCNNFKSFKITYGKRCEVSEIDTRGAVYPSFGLAGSEKESANADVITFKYSQAVQGEPPIKNGEADVFCDEMVEFSILPPTHKDRIKDEQKIILRKYFLDGKQVVTYDWLSENEKGPKKRHLKVVK